MVFGPIIITFTKLMLCNMMLKIIINCIIYIEWSMCIFILCVSLIGPLSHFDYINFKCSIITRMILVKFKIWPIYSCLSFSMWMSSFVKTSIYHAFIVSLLKNSFFDMKIFKLVIWYPNMIQTMWNDMVQYTFNFH